MDARLQITMDEYTALIHESDRDHVVEAAFSPSGVCLERTPQNQWAIDRLAEMRRQQEATQ